MIINLNFLEFRTKSQSNDEQGVLSALCKFSINYLILNVRV